MIYKEENSENISGILKLNLFCCLYIFAWILIPAFRNKTDAGVFRFLFFGVAWLWLVTSFTVKRNWLANLFPSLLLGFVTPLFMILYYVFGYGSMDLNGFVTPFFIFLCLLIGGFYDSLKNNKADRMLITGMIIFFVITALTTIYNLHININAARVLTSSSSSTVTRGYLESRNIGSFDFIYGSLILLPMLILIMKNIQISKKIFFLILLIILLIIGCLILSNFTTVYLFLLASLFFIFAPTDKKMTITMIGIIFLGIILIYLGMNLIIYVLTIMQSMTQSIMTQMKIEKIIDFLSGDIDFFEVTVRFKYAQNSIVSFFKHPIIGVGLDYDITSKIGGHSQFLDDFARFGFFGAMPLLLLFWNFKKITMKCLSEISIRNAYNFSWMYFILIGFLNRIYSYGILLAVFVVLPMVTRAFQNQITYGKEEKVVS